MRPRLKVLFVCAMNRVRSVTAERIYRTDPRLEVRAAGVRAGAMTRVSESDFGWADVVIAMEADHKLWLEMRFEGLDMPEIHVLNIPDEFQKMEPRLKILLRSSIEPLLTRLCEDRASPGHPRNSAP